MLTRTRARLHFQRNFKTFASHYYLLIAHYMELTQPVNIFRKTVYSSWLHCLIVCFLLTIDALSRIIDLSEVGYERAKDN